MLSTSGRISPQINHNQNAVLHHSVIVDEHYMLIGMNIDSNLRDKIKRGEYIDFVRLLPRDKMSSEDHKLELIHKDGQTFFVPAEKGSQIISSFHKWEQTFCVYSNIYTREHPEQASELIQYNHVICTAPASYAWDNVYTYDKEFRMHIGAFPERSWAIILQQAWSMYLKIG